MIGFFNGKTDFPFPVSLASAEKGPTDASVSCNSNSKTFPISLNFQQAKGK